MTDDRQQEPDLPTRARLEAEADELIAALRRRLEDRGSFGVPHAEFTRGWDGVRLQPPAFRGKP